jgi:hypothetical protein
MVTDVIKTRVSPETKVRVNEAAQRQLLTESVWLRRTVDAALRTAPVSEDALILVYSPCSFLCPGRDSMSDPTVPDEL